VFLVAGEPSGDLHAADLVAAIRRVAPDARLEGVGGPRMAAAGVRLVADLVSDPVMGVWPVVRRAPRFFGLYRDLLVRLDEDPPDIVVGVDYPGLNLRLARAARRRGVAFVEYVAPQVWAWAPWRAGKLARDVDRVLCILPFEEALFRDAGATAVFVGHPLFEHLAGRPRDETFRATLREGLGDAPLVALLPGSRRAEVRGNLPIQVAAAARIAALRPGARFVVPLAAERLRPLVEAMRGRGVDLVLVPPDRSDDAMAAADAAITVSGTATLHLAAHGTPAVVIYRTSAMGRALARLLVVSPFIALTNLLCGERVLPEFLAGPGDAAAIADACLRLLPGGPDRDAAVAAMAGLRERMAAPGVPERAARWVLATANDRAPSS
jgi:lipid-A-disaccharide synthase